MLVIYHVCTGRVEHVLVYGFGMSDVQVPVRSRAVT